MGTDPISMEAALAAAARDQLGGLVDSVVQGKHGFLGSSLLHRFERGLVIDIRKQAPLTLAYHDVKIYRFVSYEHMGIQWIKWRFARGDGQGWSFETTNDKRKKSDSARTQFFEEELSTTCALQRDACLQRLADGATLTFGPIEFDLRQLAFYITVPWARVAKLAVMHGTVMAKVTTGGRFIKHDHHRVAKLEDVPNFPLMWQLAHVARREAIDGG